MLNDFIDEQAFLCNLLKNQIENNNLSHAYLFDENNYSKAFEFVMSFVKTLFCKDGQDISNCGICSICKRIDDNNYPEVKLIEADGMYIKKNQIISLEQEFSRSSIESYRRVYIIRDCDKMRVESANAILKFLEEPSSSIIAILMTNNIGNILPTISSRCQKMKMISDKQLYDVDFVKHVFDFIYDVEFSKTYSFLKVKELVFDFVSVKDRDKMIEFVNYMIDIYYDILKLKDNDLNLKYLEFLDKYREICNNNEICDIIRKINYLISVKDSIKFNINISLLVDSMIINLGGSF